MAGSNVRLARLPYDFKGAVHSSFLTMVLAIRAIPFRTAYADNRLRSIQFQATGGHGGEPKNVNV